MEGITVIICTHNGLARIDKAIISILKQIVFVPLELVVVDNASSDDTGSFCRQYLEKSGSHISWKVIFAKNPGLLSARLCGIKQSKYDIILFCDDDNYPDDGYLQKGYDLMTSHPQIGVLGGCGYPVFESDPPDWFNKFSKSYAVGPQGSANGMIIEKPAYVYGAGSFYRRNVLLSIFKDDFSGILSGRNGSKLSAGDDVEWCYLMQLAGYQVWYDANLKFGHGISSGRLTWPYYLNLKKGIAAGAARFQAYLPFFRTSDPGLFQFFFSYMKEFFLTHALHLKYSFISFDSSSEAELGKVIISSKAASYRNNFFLSFSHFRNLKKKFNATGKS